MADPIRVTSLLVRIENKSAGGTREGSLCRRLAKRPLVFAGTSPVHLPGKPFRSQPSHVIERARLLKQVACTGYDCHPLLTGQVMQSRFVEGQHLWVVAPNDQ
jgi:hypothetical protein